MSESSVGSAEPLLCWPRTVNLLASPLKGFSSLPPAYSPPWKLSQCSSTIGAWPTSSGACLCVEPCEISESLIENYISIQPDRISRLTLTLPHLCDFKPSSRWIFSDSKRQAAKLRLSAYCACRYEPVRWLPTQRLRTIDLWNDLTAAEAGGALSRLNSDSYTANLVKRWISYICIGLGLSLRALGAQTERAPQVVVLLWVSQSGPVTDGRT